MLLITSSAAATPSKEQCVEDAARGQLSRDEGKLIDAREAFISCAQDACPAAGQGVCARIALDALNVYWTSGNGTVATVPKTGGTPRVLASGQAGAFGIAVDDDGIYWTTADSVMALKKRR